MIIVACMAGSLAMAQKCKVLSQEVGSIKFEVDANLPAIEEEEKALYNISSANLARSLVLSTVSYRFEPEILAYSFADEKLSYAREDVFFYSLVRAYAEHRPFVLSPDMIWQLIGFEFSEYVNNHSEEMRSLLVAHEGLKDLKIMTDEDILDDKNANWSDLFDKFSAAIAENTKGDIAQLMTSDFSTTGQTERTASQITLMESLKSYFHYIAGRLSCGIPYIILKGTPADWRKLAEKVQGLEKYNMGWWTKELKPIIAELVKTAEGKPSSKFWKDIVMQDRPDRLRGGGCSMEKPTELDGWMVKLFPDMKNGKIRATIPQSQMQGVELSKVPFKYQLIDRETMQVIEETDIMLYAGFYTAIKNKNEDAELLARLKYPALSANATTPKIKTVPEVLKQESHYQRLQLTFEDKVVIPEWMDSIQIDNFTIEGFMTDAEKAKLQKRFPKATVKRLYNKTFTRKDLASGEYAYRLDSIVLKTSSDTTVLHLSYDQQGRIAETLMTLSLTYQKPVKTIFHYDERGFCVEKDQYEVTDGKDVLTNEVKATFTDGGRLLKKELIRYNRGLKWRTDIMNYTYDQRGNLVEEGTVLNLENKSAGKLKTTYAYNARNQMTERILYGYRVPTDEFFPNITDKMEYDKQGRISHSTTIDTPGFGEDYKIETYMEYTEQNGQVVREQSKQKRPSEDKWRVKVENRAYDIYGNLVREDHEEGNTYKGSTNYYYDLTTTTDHVMGADWGNKSGMDLLKDSGLINAHNYKYRIMRVNSTNADVDFEALYGESYSDSEDRDTRYYYSEIK